jgi:hypothetical protein
VSSPHLLAGLVNVGAFAALMVARQARSHSPEASLCMTDPPALGGLVFSGGIVAPVLLGRSSRQA